jgi:hypothetical protein
MQNFYQAEIDYHREQVASYWRAKSARRAARAAARNQAVDTNAA